MSDDVLARVHTSPLRRWLGVMLLLVLGAMLVWFALAQPPAGLLWQVVLLAAGMAALVLGVWMRAATAASLELTRDVLRDSEGTVLARIDEIAGVDRGAFAFKPSNGFLLRLNTQKPRRWMPGLWWRWGRRVGIGGVTPGYQTKHMADEIQALLAERG
jgi:hypothetical protein